MENINLFKPVIKKFPRRKTLSRAKNDIWGIDLADYSKDPKMKGYILVVIDYFTRYIFTRFMRHKNKSEFDTAMQDIVKESRRLPKNIHSDLEGAFIYSDYIKKREINLYHTEFMGSPICERVIQSLKLIIEKLMVLNHSSNWKKYIESATTIYNNRIHRTIKMTPKEAYFLQKNSDLNNDLEQINNTYEVSHLPIKFKIGDVVITVKKKAIFDKGYKIRWNKTEYKIRKVINSDVNMYELSNGKTYYKEELQKVN